MTKRVGYGDDAYVSEVFSRLEYIDRHLHDAGLEMVWSECANFWNAEYSYKNHGERGFDEFAANLVTKVPDWLSRDEFYDMFRDRIERAYEDMVDQFQGEEEVDAD